MKRLVSAALMASMAAPAWGNEVIAPPFYPGSTPLTANGVTQNLLTWLGQLGWTSQAVSPTDSRFGAKCDGATDDSTAFGLWITYLTSHAVMGRLPPGTCKISSAQSWNFASRNSGFWIYGAGQGTSILDLSGVSSGIPLLITGGGTALFYGHFQDFTVKTNVAGPGVMLGTLNLADALNSFTFQQIEFKNSANNAAAVALQLNGVFAGDFINVTTNTGGGLSPPAVGGTSAGVSLQLRRSQFSRFSGSFSSAETCIDLTGDFSFGNVFTNPDAEVCNRALVIETGSAARNTFVGGTYVAATLFDFSAGAQNTLINPNTGQYTGGAVTGGTTGMILMRPGVGVTTPGVPASGTAITNTTGRVVLVTVHNDAAGLTQIIVAGSTVVANTGTVLLNPNDTISLTYASGTPSWLWRPIY